MEWGWIGGCLWELLFLGGLLAGLLALTSRASGRWSGRQRMLLGLAIVALAGAGLHALVDFPLQISSIQLYAAVYLGICWGSGRWVREGKRSGQGK
jgi:hypothetical protein